MNDIFKPDKVPEQNEQAAYVNEMFRLLLTLLHDDHSDYIRCPTPQGVSDPSNAHNEPGERIAGMCLADLTGSLFKQGFMNSSIMHIKSEL